MNHTSINDYPISYRRDIDGLRALAIILVLAFHAFPEYFPGGFIGVDIFFVISGYLITKIIYFEIHHHNFSWLDFYSRRIRRIFPALIVVLFACLIFGWLVLIAEEYLQLSKHVIAGGLFLSNILLWSEVGYFDSSADLKPLLHLWSLAVEEQFYLVWPAMLFFLFKFKILFRYIFFGCLAFSLLLNLGLIHIRPNDAFYFPIARFWELWLGASIVFYWQPLQEKIKNSKEFFFALGLAFIVFPLFFLSNKSLFPGWWAVFPCLGAMLFILTAQTIQSNLLFTNKFVVGIGLISYPLYLWHWPILSYLHIMIGESPSFLYRLLALLGAFLASILTYFCLEKYVRRNKSPYLVAGLILLLALTSFSAYLVHKKGGFESRYKKMIHIEDAYRQDFMKWEDTGLVPNIDCANGFYFPNWKICLRSRESEPTVALIGDSHAFHAYWGISESLKKEQNLILLGKGACLPFFNINLQPDGKKCGERINESLEYILNNKSIKTVIFSHRYAYLNNNVTAAQIRDFQNSVDKTFSLLERAGKKIIYIKAVPEPRVNPRLCIGDLPFGRAKPSELCSFSHMDDLRLQDTYRKSIQAVLDAHKDVHVFDPRDYYCDDDECDLIKDGKIMFMDENHISYSGSLYVGNKVSKKLNQILN